MKKLLLTLLSLILLLSTVSCNNYDEPISVTQTFHGCEFTITLDKGKYKLGDVGIVTAKIVNKSGKPVSLYSWSEYEYVQFYFLEDGKLKFTNASEAVRDITLYHDIPDGKEYVYDMSFDLTAPEGTQEPLNPGSEWKIKADADIIFDNEGETISLEIIVPH